MLYFIYTYRKGISTKRKKKVSETLEPEISYAVFRQKVHPFQVYILTLIYRTALLPFNILIKNTHKLLSTLKILGLQSDAFLFSNICLVNSKFRTNERAKTEEKPSKDRCLVQLL